MDYYKIIFSIVIIIFLVGCQSYSESCDDSLFIKPYGEMWNYSKTTSPYMFHIDASNVYYNLSGLVAGDLKYFTFVNNNRTRGGSHLISQKPGLYKTAFTLSFLSEANGGLYGVSISQNYNVSKHRNCYSRRSASTSVGSISVTCLLDLDINDTVSIQIENENTDRDIMIHTANLNLIKIG